MSLKKTPFILISLAAIICLGIACEKENDDQRELNITYIEHKEGITNKGIGGSNQQNVIVDYFPNPFRDRLSFFISTNEEIEILITNDEGDYKEFDIVQGNFSLDFNDEKNGTYYCEIRVGDKVYQDHLIKIDIK